MLLHRQYHAKRASLIRPKLEGHLICTTILWQWQLPDSRTWINLRKRNPSTLKSDYASWPANTADATAARVTVIITVSNEITTTQTILLQQSWQLAYHYGHLRHQSTSVVSVCCTPDLTWLVRFSATRPIATNTRPLAPYPLPIPHVQVSRYLLLVWLVSNKDNSNDKQINL